MQSMYEHGYLELIIGPMYSGKTSYLMNVFKQCLFCNTNVLVFNHDSDTRYDNDMLSTHDQIKIPCIKTNSLSEYLQSDIYNNSEVILINEGQFFDDIFDFVLYSVDIKCKRVYVCGLDGDFKRNKFGKINDLIPYCDNVKKLRSLCQMCKNGNKAIFSHRLTSEIEQQVIGSTNYVPLCRKCYLKENGNTLKILANI